MTNSKRGGVGGGGGGGRILEHTCPQSLAFTCKLMGMQPPCTQEMLLRTHTHTYVHIHVFS